MKKFGMVLLVICSVLTLAGAVAFAWNRRESTLTENTVIEINGNTKKTLKAELSGFYPGCVQSYTIVLSHETTEAYTIALTFRNDEKSGTLGNYLTVRIEADGTTAEKPLNEVLGGEEIALGKNIDEIKITYTMSENTGNEAQGAVVDFYIDLTAKKI